MHDFQWLAYGLAAVCEMHYLIFLGFVQTESKNGFCFVVFLFLFLFCVLCLSCFFVSISLYCLLIHVFISCFFFLCFVLFLVVFVLSCL